jgi:hypothetical protein
MPLFNVLEPTECSVGANCKNSITSIGKGRAHCPDCRLAPDNEELAATHWRPKTPRDRHPVLEAEKLQARRNKAQANLTKRLGVNRNRRAVGKRAARSEAKALKTLNAVPTVNSGRKLMDGDMSGAGIITLDNKDQSKNENPVVSMAELHKVREDAKRAGKPIGGLILRNKFGVGVVVFDEADFARVLGYLTEK